MLGDRVAGDLLRREVAVRGRAEQRRIVDAGPCRIEVRPLEVDAGERGAGDELAERGRLLDESYPAAIRGDLLTVTVARLGTNALIRFAPPFLGVIASGLDVTVGRLGVALTVAPRECGFNKAA